MDLSVDHRNAYRGLCAVTGGRGFMARHLVTALLRSGDWRVRITDLGPDAALSPAEDDGLLEAALRDGRATYVPADVCKLGHLTKAFEGVDTVFHTAAPDHSNNNFQLHYKVNVQGTKNVIEACKKCKVKKLIYTSSSGVVFDGVHGLFGVDESTPYPDKKSSGAGAGACEQGEASEVSDSGREWRRLPAGNTQVLGEKRAPDSSMTQAEGNGKSS